MVGRASGSGMGTSAASLNLVLYLSRTSDAGSATNWLVIVAGVVGNVGSFDVFVSSRHLLS